MNWQVIRKQLTPPGKDRVQVELWSATREYVAKTVLHLAKSEAQLREEESSIAYDPSMNDVEIRASLVGQPGNKGPLYATIASYVAVEMPKETEQKEEPCQSTM